MRKLALSFSMALVSLFVLANIALAQDWTEQAQYKVSVTGTDEVSGGQGVWVNRWSAELANRWQRTYNWTPKMPIRIYLYSSGTEMANGLSVLRGSALTTADMGEVATQEAALTVMDMRPTNAGGTGGWVILLNLNSGQFGTGIGAVNWTNQVEATLAREMARLMVVDLAGQSGPVWLRVGIVNYLVVSEAPEWLAPAQWTAALNAQISAGTAPGLIALHNDWTGVTGMSPTMFAASNAVATKTVQYLVPRVGLNGLVNLLRDSQSSSDFNAMVSRLTGWNLIQLDQVYRNAL